MGKREFKKEEAVMLLEALEKKDEGTLAALGVESLAEITEIDLRRFGITTLPAEIGQLSNLQILNLSNTPITTLPAEIGQLSELQRLDLEGTPISTLPAEIGRLKNLQWLDLSNTSITALPSEIGRLTNLQRLDLSNTPITALPSEIGQLISLQNLNLSDTQISAFPMDILQLTSLLELDLSNTQIFSLPAGIGQLTSLYQLDLNNTQISSLPTEISQLINLRALSLSDTQISALPPEIGQLTYIQWLDFDGLDIAALPEFLCSLSDLTSLSFERTKIRTIPSWIKELKSLRILWISGLILKEIPREVFELDIPFFSSLDAYYSQPNFSYGSNEVVPFGSKGIIMEGTVLKTQPVRLFGLDRGFIQAYYDEPKIPIREGKVIFLGDGGAGKSHTIERILKNGADEGINTDQTPGINIKSWEPDCGVKINFWDFGGQEIMHAMHRCFLTGRSLYVVVLRERSQSRHNDLTLQARYWLENINSFAPDCPVILAVNREQGVAGSAGINSKQLRDEFKGIVCDPIFYCARKDEDDNFETLTKKILEQARLLDSTEMEFPRSWNNVRSALDDMSNRRGRTGSEDYIDKEEYKKLCTEQGITDENIQRWLLEWFNDLGVCFSYHQEDGKELERYQVLNPEWLTNAIYAIINIGKRPEFSTNGVITRSEINTILSDPSKYAKERTAKDPITYDENEQGYVLDIMKKFSLCAEIDERNQFIPALCSPETPKRFRPGADEYTDHTRFEFRYGFLPDSVIHRLMIECIRAGFHRTAAYFSGIRVDFVPDEVVLTAEADIAKNILAIDLYHKGDFASSKNKLSWVRRKVAEINSSMNLKPEHEIIVVCDGENRADLRLDMLFKLHERGRQRTDLPAYQEDEIVECDLDAALRLLYDDRVINRADRIMKRRPEHDKKTYRDALAIAEAEKERGEKDLEAGGNASFLLGVSFAGEQREYVRRMMTSLCDDWGFAREELFFDEWQEHLINGANADILLDKIYSERCEKVVVLFSEAYLNKHWTNKLEWRRAITTRIAADPENVCLLRFGDVDIDSIDLLHCRKDIVKDVSDMTPYQAAEFIQKWYERPAL